ncbi:synaptic vesicle glycoprotein 2B isoform X1 [Cephus cinctus]|uniref:Synaptic vesicle glycoprotein 2B isoform X1 n=1 Tax=Cephus cinctus TaxID=211228 RepID=A0AAJ7FQ01_CEPCN|nr:synaptic vesicle glycoprotein 2B isoform X1 [Cephus cinctus]XP_015602592.1 synaptic vesicle glycoprotein 2B isoform X1 [Cephus cinctus]XP_015602594.1 synaptic vesicle glycoprotein 2B isoform X1 [Cephus cinctus]XP_015602595.1 synaptic vesicle glycoprotein 2B isoform X1 [Cephus cinctus]XP_024944306.1 synaptic vesicle glycoprotein 2B isoform X1 [Cephus cinctus]
MPSSEEESQWLVGTGAVLGSSGTGVPSSGSGERTPGTRSTLYTEEMSSQVGNAAAAGVNTSSADSAEHDLIDSTADATLLAQFHEDAIKQAGVGYFQVLAALCTGLSLAADTVEFFVVPYILPSAEVELCIEDNEKGWLGNITLVGLAIGGLCWGGLGDRLGRRRALLSAMAVHALFSGVATFMPTYGTFMTARFCSAIGVGGSLPLAFAYLAECCPRSSRGRWTGALVGAGALGGVYAALLAWAMVPTTGEMVVLENKEHFSAWHRFLLLCCLPALCATVGLVFLPESPRYLIEAGRDVEAMMVYQRIYKRNNARKGATGAQYQLSELELPSKRPRGLAPPSPTSHASVLADIMYSIEMFWNSFLELFSTPHLRVTVVLLVIWSAAAFGLYGLMVWCPEYLKLLRATEYEAHTKQIVNETFHDQKFTGSLENSQYKNSTFLNCQFTKMVFSHVNFDNCTFHSVEFSNIKSSKTHFTDSIIVDSKFVDTDLSAQVFTRCTLENNTELSLSGPCPTLDLDYNIYIEEALHGHLVAQLAFVPAAALAGLALTILQRPKMIGISLFFSSVAALCLMLVGTNSSAVLGFEGGFIAVFAVGWTSLTLATVESFPTHLRCTGFGFMTAGIRLSGLIGTATYQTLVGAPLIAPALLTATALLVASAATFKLPHTHTVFL